MGKLNSYETIDGVPHLKVTSVPSSSGALAPNATTSGFYVALGTANADPGGVAIPAGARSLVVWFETSSSDATLVRGRIGFNASATAIGSLSATDNDKLGYSPALAVEYPVPSDATYVHVASSTASAVVRGSWLF